MEGADRELQESAIEAWAAAAREKWALIAPQAPERLVTPGSPGFRCQPRTCDALCCGSPYLAGASERDVEVLHGAGYETLQFLDIDPGDLSELFGAGLRWSQVVTLRQPEGRCVFLGEDLRCQAYEARPDGCALYPYRLVFVPVEGDQIATAVESVEALERSVGVALGREAGEAEFVPLVLRDMSCPGFTEAPLGPGECGDLLARVWSLDGCASHGRPCDRHGGGR